MYFIVDMNATNKYKFLGLISTITSVNVVVLDRINNNFEILYENLSLISLTE